jgi:vesicle-fusing ATPase
MRKELLVGTVLGLAFFAVLQGHWQDLIPLVLLAAIGYYLYQSNGLRGSRKKLVAADVSQQRYRVSFDHIGGQETAKKELVEALEFMTNPEAVQELGIRPIKGLLLSGPPGTGKTLLAKAAAGYTGSTFLSTSGSNFIEMYAGVGAQRVRKLFERARKTAAEEERDSAVIFIDEIEVLGGKRGRHASHLEYDQTLNQLLVEMDGLNADDDVRILLIGATNRDDLLDSALTRPGRFDRVVRVDLPDREGRLAILELHTVDKPLHSDVDLNRIARDTFGFSGAHLESLTNEAAILALRDEDNTIRQRHLTEAVEKVIMGEKLDRRPSDSELFRVAVHESGHAIVSELLEPESVASISIAPRGGALGYVRHAQEEDRYIHTEKQLREQVARLLGGTVAEEVVFGHRSTGARGDFKKALQLVRELIFSGMSSLGIVSEEHLPHRLLHEECTELVEDLEADVHEHLAPREELLRALGRLLVQEEKLDGARLRSWLADQNETEQERPERRVQGPTH